MNRGIAPQTVAPGLRPESFAVGPWPLQGIMVLVGLDTRSLQRLREQRPVDQPVPDGPVTATFDGDLGALMSALVTAVEPGAAERIFVAIGELAPVTPESLLRVMVHLQPLAALLGDWGGDRFWQTLDRQSLVAYLQPIVRISDGTIHGYEALMRGLGAEHVRLPGDLFGHAQQAGQLRQLDQVACLAALTAKARHIPRGRRVFVNFLPDASDETITIQTFTTMQRLGIPATDVVFEVVNAERIGDLRHARALIDGYREMGAAISLDDIGSGSAALQLVSSLRPDYVKVDRALIAGVHRDPERQAAADWIAKLCQDLGIVAVAKGIEHEADYAIVAQLGFQLAQGYLIGRPTPEPEPIFGRQSAPCGR